MPATRSPEWIHSRLRESGVTCVGCGDLTGWEDIPYPPARRMIALGQIMQGLTDRLGFVPTILRGWNSVRPLFNPGGVLDVGCEPERLERLQLAACDLWRSDTRLFGLGLELDHVRLETWRDDVLERRYWGPRVALMFAS